MTNTSTLKRVERACVEIHRSGKGVTFTGVAAATGLGRSALYRDPTIRQVIAEHRLRAASNGTITGLTDEIATLRTAVDALAERVRRQEEKLRRLEPRKH